MDQKEDTISENSFEDDNFMNLANWTKNANLETENLMSELDNKMIHLSEAEK